MMDGTCGHVRGTALGTELTLLMEQMNRVLMWPEQGSPR